MKMPLDTTGLALGEGKNRQQKTSSIARKVFGDNRLSLTRELAYLSESCTRLSDYSKHTQTAGMKCTF